MKTNSKNILILALLGLSTLASARNSTNSPAKVTIEDKGINREIRAPISFAPVIKRVAPSVVNIYSTMTIRDRGMQNPFLNDPLFRRFFGDQFGQMQPRD